MGGCTSSPCRCACVSTGPTTCGITSPARCTITVSPTRTSLRLMSSSLCSVASFTVAPPMFTGSRTAYGFMLPVRPTLTPMSSSVVVRCVGGNLNAIAQRGSRPTTPSCSCSRRSSIFTTTPSISYGRSSRFSYPAFAVRDDVIDRLVADDVRVDLEAELAQPGQRLVVAVR